MCLLFPVERVTSRTSILAEGLAWLVMKRRAESVERGVAERPRGWKSVPREGWWSGMGGVEGVSWFQR